MAREAPSDIPPLPSLDDIDAGFRERLHELLEHHSQAEIARRTGVRPQNIHRYLTDTRIPAAFCAQLISKLNINPAWLVTGEGTPMLADVTMGTSETAGDLLELVNAMNSVARMRLGNLAGQDYLKVFQELNDALARFQSMRDALNKRSAPVFKQILDELDQALRDRKHGRALDLLKAGEQVGRLCDDDELNARFDTLRGLYERRHFNAERSLHYARRSYLRLLLDADALTPEKADQVADFIFHLAATWRLREARSRCQAMLRLFEGRDDLFAARRRLLVQRSMFDCELGNPQRAVDTMLAVDASARGPDERGNAFVLVRAMLISGRCDPFTAFNLGPDTVHKADIITGYAIWTEDVALLKATRERWLERPEIAALRRERGPSPHDELFPLQIDCIVALKERGDASLVEVTLQKFGTANTTISVQPSLQGLYSSVYRAQIMRIAGRKDEALQAARATAQAIAAISPEFSIDILVRATHYRGILELVSAGAGTSEDRALRERAQAFFDVAVKQGYNAFSAFSGRVAPAFI